VISTNGLSRPCRYNCRNVEMSSSIPRFLASSMNDDVLSGWLWVNTQGIEATSTAVAPDGWFTGYSIALGSVGFD
jgi:hypothetical protein